jgi:hypothetical protein
MSTSSRAEQMISRINNNSPILGATDMFRPLLIREQKIRSRRGAGYSWLPI